MSRVSGNPTSTQQLIHRLRLMADAGGMLTRDRIRTLIESADRMEMYSEREEHEADTKEGESE